MEEVEMSRKNKGNCENCDSCVYVGEGDFICDEYVPSVCVKVDWEPTDYYCDCEACRNYSYEEENELSEDD